jgi:hypothetical protein
VRRPGVFVSSRFGGRLLFQRSPDDWDDREVDRILREHVSAAALPEARKVLEQAADALVLSAPFDTLRRALSKHLKPNTFMTGDEAEAILLEAYEKYAAMQAAYRRSISGRRESPSLSTPRSWT